MVTFKIKLGRKQKSQKSQFRRIISLYCEALNVLIYDLNKKLNEGTCLHVQSGLKCVDCCTESYKLNIGKKFDLAAPKISEIIDNRD